MSEQWCPFAVREPGHPEAHGYRGEQEPGHKQGLCCHSAEGYLAHMREIIASPGSPSWTFTNPQRGPLIQHYPVGYHTWTNSWDGGPAWPNVRYFSCESEGVAGDPLTESQVQNLIDLARWGKKRFGWVGRPRRNWLWEHNEYGAPTACPSGRIPWERIIAGLEEEEDMAAIDELRRDVDRLTLENRLQQGALELQKRINELQQGWLTQHAAEHATAPELIPPLPPELAERVAELEAKVAEAGAALAG